MMGVSEEMGFNPQRQSLLSPSTFNSRLHQQGRGSRLIPSSLDATFHSTIEIKRKPFLLLLSSHLRVFERRRPHV